MDIELHLVVNLESVIMVQYNAERLLVKSLEMVKRKGTVCVKLKPREMNIDIKRSINNITCINKDRRSRL